MKFDELIELIKEGTISPYMNISVFFESLSKEECSSIEKLAKEQGSEYEIENEFHGIHIDDLDTFFFYNKAKKEEFGENIADFLLKLNQIKEISSVNLCCVINLGD